MLQLPFKAKAIVSWPGEEPGDLGFLEDEVIEVTGFVDGSWWNGYLLRNKAEGIFPRDYVAPMPGAEVEPDQDPNVATKPAKSLPNRSTRSRDEYSRSTRQQDDHGRSRSSPNVKFKPSVMQSKSTPNIKSHLQEKHIVRTNSSSQLSTPPSSVSSAPPPPMHRQGSAFKTPIYPQLDGEHANPDHTHQSRESARSTAKNPRKTRPESSLTPEDIAIARKRAQLELELLHLYQLEKNMTHQRKDLTALPDSRSESPHSSRGDDLGKSLDRDPSFAYEEEEEEDDDDGNKSVNFHNGNHDDEDDDDDAPPPPPPKRSNATKNGDQSLVERSVARGAPMRMPFDAADFRLSDNSNSRLFLSDDDINRISQMQPSELRESIQSLRSDVLNLSEFSATSAGSFMRHKQEAMLNSQISDFNISSADPPMDSAANAAAADVANRRAVMEQVFDERKGRQNIFKKILNKRNGDDTNTLERKVQEIELDDWAVLKASLHRMNSLATLDKQARTRRVLRQEGNLIVKPWDYVTSVNANETIDDNEFTADENENPFNMNASMLRRIDAFMAKYEPTTDLNDVIADVSAKFHASAACQIRCILIHLSQFKVIEEAGKILMVKPRLTEVTSKGQVTIFQLNYLFKKILDAFRIPSEIVVGFWKKPNEFYHNEEYVVNHCWLSILVENKFLVADIFCFKNGSMFNIRDHPRGFNEFYAGAEPLLIVSTHIPSVIDLQHIVPPIDHNVAFHLPRAYLGFYRNRLQFVNHNNALSRLKDMEIFELELEVPSTVELFTLVKTCKATTNELSLCQVKWVKSRRIAKIKAILPGLESIGVLQVFAGPKGSQKHFDNVHELAVVIPLYHEGECKPGKFVSRYPTVQCQNHDLYIQQPQTCMLVKQNAYNFEILQYPSSGLQPQTDGSKVAGVKLVIESPLGKYYKLVSEDPNKPYGTYLCNIRCQEVGLYRGLVIGDSGTSWYVFAQWECANNA